MWGNRGKGGWDASQKARDCKKNLEALGTKEHQNSPSMVSKGEMNGVREGEAGARPSS